jgi:aminoglycoside 6'-N-acetyltransferase
VAVDIFVSATVYGRGVGPDAMRALIAWLIDMRGHHRITVDPAAANARAIHVYEKLGFRPVGVLRRYERVEGDEWRDALLMDLLAEEFVRHS